MSVLPQLFGGLEVLIIDPVFVILTVVGCVDSTNLRPSFISAAALIREKVLAVCDDHQKPASVVDKDADWSMHHIPSHVVKVVPLRGRIDSECKVSTAFCSTIAAENLNFLKVLSTNSGWHF